MTGLHSVVRIDCIEQVHAERLPGLFERLKQVQREAFSIDTGGSTGTGQELHVHRTSLAEWTRIIQEHFEIVEAIETHSERILYLSRRRRTSRALSLFARSGTVLRGSLG